MKGYDFFYFLREGVKSIFLHGFMSFAAVSVILACLIIIGSFMLLTMNVSMIISEAETSTEMVAFVDDTLSLSEARSIGSKINRIENVSKSTFVSSEKAFEEYAQELGEDSYLLEGFEGESILRHRYRVYIEDVSLTSETAERIRKIPGIAKVNASLEISQSIMNMKNVVSAVTYILAAILVGVSIFIISNTVKLTTFDRREEIAIMKMVGATNAFIRWPFVFEGFILGTLGGALAFVGQWAIYNYAVQKISESLSIINLINFQTIAIPMFILFLISGFLVGIGGSVLTIRKFMRV
ncbi:MAG: permease-like cell division protein FtsX [Eubacteriales bacterium]|jgi:cell division transport system permease protein